MARAQVEVACIPEPFDGERLREVCAVFEDERLWAKVDASGQTARELVVGQTFCRVYVDGEPVAFYVLYFYQGDEGTEAFITAAHGRATLDLCRVVVPLIEQQCAGCKGVAMRTKRRGLMRKMAAAGYATVTENEGVAQMRKAL